MSNNVPRPEPNDADTRREQGRDGTKEERVEQLREISEKSRDRNDSRGNRSD